MLSFINQLLLVRLYQAILLKYHIVLLQLRIPQYMKEIISYWSEPKIAYHDTNKGFSVIYGKYNHLNKEKIARKCLGLHWEDYPYARNVLAPMVVPSEIRNSILAGLLKDGLDGKNQVNINEILKAIEYFKSEDPQEAS